MTKASRWYWFLPWTWGITIIYLSLLPGGAGILTLFGIPHFDKILHIGGYGLLALLWMFASIRVHGPSGRRAWIIFGICLGMGCLLEIGQYYMHAGRSFEYLDMLANGFGAFLGVVFSRRVFK